MKNKYQQLMYKDEFITMLSSKLNLKKETVQYYFTTGNIPKIHHQRINDALDTQLSLDKKIKQIRVNFYENI
jgi:hypothetical protein